MSALLIKRHGCDWRIAVRVVVVDEAGAGLILVEAVSTRSAAVVLGGLGWSSVTCDAATLGAGTWAKVMRGGIVYLSLAHASLTVIVCGSTSPSDRANLLLGVCCDRGAILLSGVLSLWHIRYDRAILLLGVCCNRGAILLSGVLSWWQIRCD